MQTGSKNLTQNNITVSGFTRRFNHSCAAVPLTVVYGILIGFIKILLRAIGYMFFIIACKVLFMVWLFNRLCCLFLGCDKYQAAHCCGSLPSLMMLRRDLLEAALLDIVAHGLKWHPGDAEKREHAGWADIMLFSFSLQPTQTLRQSHNLWNPRGRERICMQGFWWEFGGQ